MTKTPANYFLRDITEIRITCESEIPADPGANMEYPQQPKHRRTVGLRRIAFVERGFLMIAPPTCKLGDTLVFEGYADDYGEHIAAVEFSLDGGTSWTAFDTGNSAPDLMVRWTYSYEPTKSGRYQLKVRSVSDDGRRSHKLP